MGGRGRGGGTGVGGGCATDAASAGPEAAAPHGDGAYSHQNVKSPRQAHHSYVHRLSLYDRCIADTSLCKVTCTHPW